MVPSSRRAGLLLALLLAGSSPTSRALAQEPAPDPWRVVLAGGAEAWDSGGFGTHGWLLVDAQRDRVANGRLHLLYNTDTLQVGLEGMRARGGKLEGSVILRGEALLAGLLFDYYRRGERDGGRSFAASYLTLVPSLKWHPAARHSLELQLGLRQWFFGRRGETADDFTLPPDTFVFEPRLSYTFWRLEARGLEWEAHRFFPRYSGFAFGATFGMDLRSDGRAFGADVGGQLDPRNDPGRVILSGRQWMAAGVRLAGWGRLQLHQQASWGVGEDDLTRNRVGGMNPYVISIAGLPWAAVLSERLVSAQLSLHVRAGRRSPHELGILANGGVFNDLRRVGELMEFGGAGGVGAFADLRFGRVQLHGRFGYALPAPFLATGPNLSGMLTAGIRLR